MTSQVVENFKNMYESASEITDERLSAVYADDIIFIDPIHRVEGREALGKYLSIMYGNVESCRFTYHDQIVDNDRACIKWNMCFRHGKLAGGSEIDVRGVTLVEFSDRIFKHEDFFDVGSMLYENVPVLGSTIRYLKRRIS